MLTIQGSPNRLCDGLARRDFLRVGALGACGLSLPALTQAASRAAPHGTFGRAKRCILLFMWGGPPQQDTWDLKPDAPAEIRGELKPIATKAPGVCISELLPRLATHADKYAVVRSVTHNDRVHTTSFHTMVTGTYHRAPNVRDVNPDVNDHPHLGSILATARPGSSGMPGFVALPEIVHTTDGTVAPGQTGGFLGQGAAPLRVKANIAEERLLLPDVYLPPDVDAKRLADRRAILQRVEHRFRLAERSGALSDMDENYRKAFAMISSPKAREAFNLAGEPDRVRAAYGSHLFGQGALLARRLIEAGVSLVTVYWHYEGPSDSPAWDTHRNNYGHLRTRLAPHADLAFSALLADLSERGLLDETLVVWMGEFGRTPKINARGGRDHWPFVQSVVLAGGGVEGGRVYGSSDRIAGHPADQPVSPPDLAATILHLLGVPDDLVLYDSLNRPHPACRGTMIPGLIAG